MSSEINREDWGDALMRNPVEFREWWKILFRVWRPHLTPNQFLVVMFIYDRTAGWGKEWEIITHDQFLDGVTGKDGKCYASGLRLGRTTLVSTLQHVVTVGAIRTRKHKRRTAYAINHEWNPEELNPDNLTEMPLAKPKRLQSLQTESTAKGSKTEPFEGSKTEPYKKRKEKRFAETEGNASHSREEDAEPTIDARLSATRSRFRERHEAKLAKGTPAATVALWDDLCREHHPDLTHLAVTKADSAILHKYGQRWLKAQKRKQSEWRDYLSWIVRRWPAIRSEHFAWMKATSPGVPSIRFLVRFSDRFEQAWASRQDIERVARMTTRELEVARLVSKGMDRDVAEKEADARLGLTRERAKLEQAAAALQRQRDGVKKDEAARAESDARNEHWRRVRKTPLDLTEGTHDAWL